MPSITVCLKQNHWHTNIVSVYTCRLLEYLISVLDDTTLQGFMVTRGEISDADNNDHSGGCRSRREVTFRHLFAFPMVCLMSSTCEWLPFCPCGQRNWRSRDNHVGLCIRHDNSCHYISPHLLVGLRVNCNCLRKIIAFMDFKLSLRTIILKTCDFPIQNKCRNIYLM